MQQEDESAEAPTNRGETPNQPVSLPPHLVEDRFKNRRSMAWISFMTLLFYLFFFAIMAPFLFTNGEIEPFNGVIISIISGLLAIVVAYMGTSATDDWAKRKFDGKGKG